MKQVEAAVYFLDDSEQQARQLADLLGLPVSPIKRHVFPDGESLLRVTLSSQVAVVLLPLDNPNQKLVELLLTTSVLRESGAERVILVAPYLCYMRQDMAFREGEAASQKVIGGFLAGLFDAVVTVDPHLHRTKNLADALPGTQARALTATEALAHHLEVKGCSEDTLLVGPDEESKQWVEAVAAPLNLDVLVGEKCRHGDREVSIVIPDVALAAGRPAILIDDVVSTGRTMVESAGLLKEAGATSVSALIVHLLQVRGALSALRNADIAPIVATDSVASECSEIALAPLLAPAVRDVIARASR